MAPLLSSLRSLREVGRSLSLVSLCLEDYLFVDENTLRSLSVCSSDVHGFVHARAGREGFSILGMSRDTLIGTQASTENVEIIDSCAVFLLFRHTGMQRC